MNLEYITLVPLILLITCERAQSQCPVNEEDIGCASRCQPTCDNPILDPNMVCRLDCAICVCRAGFIRETAGGRCIPKDKCPRCPLNEKRVKCASPCRQPTCQNQNPDPDAVCLAVCLTCICDDGFIRDENTGRCVLLDNCPSSFKY